MSEFQMTDNVTRAVDINKYWDRASKILIMIVDASLNIYFIKTVRSRLLKRSGLHKYKPLAAFNEKMMAVSVCMDVSDYSICIARGSTFANYVPY